MIYPPNQKPPIWSIDPGVIAYNCQKAGMPHPVLAMPMWEGAGNRALDYSGRGNHGTLNTGATWVSEGIDFDGGGGYVDCGSRITLNAITISAWFKLTNYALSSNDSILNAESSGPGTKLQYRGIVDDKVRWVVDSVGNTVYSPVITDNNWHYIIATADEAAGEMKIYFDGVISQSSSGLTLTIGTNTLEIGRDINNANHFNGHIKYINIFDTALSSPQASFIHNNPYFMYQIPEELYGYVAAAAGVSIPVFLHHYNQMRQ